MTEHEVAKYDEAMRRGHYLTGLDIALRANAPEDITDEDLYAPILDKLFPPRVTIKGDK